MRKTFLLNLLFTIAIVYLALNLNQIWGPSPPPSLQIKALPQAQPAKVKKSAAKKAGKTVAALSSYKVIGQRNLFRPQRKEWTPPPPPPPPPRKPKKKEPPPLPPPPPPDPLPEPTVLGIIIRKDDKVALMQGHKREEISSPARRSSRRSSSKRYTTPKRYRIIQEPMGRYHVGDTISEGRIIKILRERVVLEREGIILQLLLRDPKKKSRSGSSRKKSSRRRSPRSRRR